MKPLIDRQESRTANGTLGVRITMTIFILLLFTGITERLFACSCIGKRTVQDEVKYADALVVGTILSKQIVTLTDSTVLKMFLNDSTWRNSSMSKMTIARYKLLINEIYKGKITNDTLTIYTGLGGGDCGIQFEIGKNYIVYGKNDAYFGRVNNDFEFPKIKNTFWTYQCLRTSSYYRDEIVEIEKYAKRKDMDIDDEILVNPDIPPIFKYDGDIGLKKFIDKNLRFPTTAESATGIVYVGFTVDTLGNVKNIEIKRGMTPLTDEEAIRVVKMLTFIPGTSYGRPIETEMVLPISFAIEYKDDK